MNLRVAITSVVLTLAIPLLGSRLVIATESGASSPAPAAAQAQGNPQAGPAPGTQSADGTGQAKENVPAFRPRLPAYYGKVVDEKQRQKIYDIQRKYHAQIAELQRQLEKLIAQRDAEIEAVLTPQQKTEIEKMQQEAAARRSKNAKSEGENSASQTAQP
ncbi:hypothetical protein [Thermogutta sp.]|jgi:hypothetical protein|uniref:hypothetical protein n=1 Tax=Thermogutta sp. TaxID=1962930 RepID=UPI0032204362